MHEKGWQKTNIIISKQNEKHHQCHFSTEVTNGATSSFYNAYILLQPAPKPLVAKLLLFADGLSNAAVVACTYKL